MERSVVTNCHNTIRRISSRSLALALACGVLAACGAGNPYTHNMKKPYEPHPYSGEFSEQPPIPHYEVRQAISAIKIDGVLSEKSWSLARDVGPFYHFDGRPLDPKHPPVTVKIIYDDDALYLGWTCRDSNIVATLTERDAHLWLEDVVEVFVDPTGELADYYEIIVNPLNAIFDAYQVVSAERIWPATSDWSWTAEGMETAVHVKGRVKAPTAPAGGDSSWTVEMKMPWTMFDRHNLSRAPEPGAIWRMALTRYDGRDSAEPEHIHYAWSPPYQLGNPHKVDYMGYLHFSGVPVDWKKPNPKPLGYY